jgi:spermine oxidase
MLKAIPQSAVKCNEPVETIVWENNAGNDVIVRTSSGVEYNCKHVLVTCSIGFLKEHWTDFFQPSLPAERIALYDGIGYGSITKVIMLYTYFIKDYYLIIN